MTKLRKLERVAVVAACAICALTWPARAQVILDMSLITCQQYLTYDAERQNMVAAWMGGYFNAAINQPVISYERFTYNKGVVTDYCRAHEYETLMSAIRQTVF